MIALSFDQNRRNLEIENTQSRESIPQGAIRRDTGGCRIHAVATDSGAHAALLKTDPALEKCLALGRYVIVKTDDTSAVYLNHDGISQANDKQLKKLIAALAKPPTKR